ncbi:MAG: hypothetical protein SFY66_00705 [Oculatellaceae cyanobacterium bins.114]|nr:hypothetical protein [Oculatellaceae cyanobacterium bins.114]
MNEACCAIALTVYVSILTLPQKLRLLAGLKPFPVQRLAQYQSLDFGKSSG